MRYRSFGGLIGRQIRSSMVAPGMRRACGTDSREKPRRSTAMRQSLRNSMLAIAIAGLAAAAAWANETITYTYDSRGRLVKVVRTGTINNNVKAEYKYDKAENRT